MSYKPAMPGMFAVPDTLVDEHLKLARELQLKVLLWILRHGEAEGLEALAHWLGRPEGDLVDAAQFWIDRGIIEIDGSSLSNNDNFLSNNDNRLPQKLSINDNSGAVPAAAALPPVRPTASQILARTGEDAELRGLFKAAGDILGRTIGYEGQCMLLLLNDTCGLPVEVIFMLLQYCADEEKTHINYIEKLGFDWGAKGIDSIEKAGTYITQLKESKSLWGQLCRHAGKDIPKGKSREKFLLRWSGELGFGMDMICLAYDEMADNCSRIEFSYMNKVMETWHAAGIKTPAGAEAAKEQFRAKQDKSAPGKPRQDGPAGYGPSFDLEAFERSTLQVPVFEANA